MLFFYQIHNFLLYLFFFATENQKLFGTNVPVTPELLYSEFSKLYKRLDRNKWKEAIKNDSKEKEMPSTDI